MLRTVATASSTTAARSVFTGRRATYDLELRQIEHIADQLVQVLRALVHSAEVHKNPGEAPCLGRLAAC